MTPVQTDAAPETFEETFDDPYYETRAGDHGSRSGPPAEPPAEPHWHGPAPRARKAAMALYAWQDPGWVFVAAILLASPFMIAAALAPALLSLTPTVDMIAPIAAARAVANGSAMATDAASPFYLLLLLAADIFVDAPGRMHLLAKAFAAALIAYPMAYIAAARFPAAQTLLMTAALSAYATAPFAGVGELGLAFFAVLAVGFVCAPADDRRGRAVFEGILGGAILAILWHLSPVFALLGFMALSACPFLTGRSGLDRYVGALAVFVVIGVAMEFFAPGINFSRADAASASITNFFSGAGGAPAGGAGFGLAGIMASAGIVIFAAAVFGGKDHAKGWAAGAGLLIASFIGATVAGANAAPLFGLAAALAAFSVASPFYDGVFRHHDRASIAIAASAAALTLFWTAAIIFHAVGQFTLQYRVAQSAPADIRTELGLVQPGGPTIARWIEEGRFSTPEARELFAIAPIDQSQMLLEAAARVRQIARAGIEAAILTGADTACVIAARRQCRADGPAAAHAAKVVFVPRLDLDPATALAKGRVEALLYTEFRLVEQTALWDVWVRRGVTLPKGLVANSLPGV